MNYIEIANHGIERGWIAPKPRTPHVKYKHYATREESEAARKLMRKEWRARKRFRERLGKPIIQRLVPLSRKMFPKGAEGEKAYHAAYDKIWIKIRKTTNKRKGTE